MGGVAFVTLSYRFAELPGQWLSDVLLGLGASLVLFLPLYVIGRHLDGHLDRVERETAAAIEEVREESNAQVQAITQRLDDLAETASERLIAERERDTELFRSLKYELSRESLRSALNRALDQRIIDSAHHPRVKVSAAHSLFLTVYTIGAPTSDDQRLVADLVGLSGRRLVPDIEWLPEDTAEDFIVKVGRALSSHDAGQPFDAAGYFDALSDLLLVGLSHEERRPIIELCPPQWAIVRAVVGGAVVTYGDSTPLVDATLGEFNNNKHLLAHLHEKPWVDHNSLDTAYLSLIEMF